MITSLDTIGAKRRKATGSVFSGVCASEAAVPLINKAAQFSKRARATSYIMLVKVLWQTYRARSRSELADKTIAFDRVIARPGLFKNVSLPRGWKPGSIHRQREFSLQRERSRSFQRGEIFHQRKQPAQREYPLLEYDSTPLEAPVAESLSLSSGNFIHRLVFISTCLSPSVLLLSLR